MCQWFRCLNLHLQVESSSTSVARQNYFALLDHRPFITKYWGPILPVITALMKPRNITPCILIQLYNTSMHYLSVKEKRKTTRSQITFIDQRVIISVTSICLRCMLSPRGIRSNLPSDSTRICTKSIMCSYNNYCMFNNNTCRSRYFYYHLLCLSFLVMLMVPQANLPKVL